MLEAFSKLVATLLAMDSSPEAMLRWRLCITFFAAFMLVHVAWACGWIPPLSGFALQSEVVPRFAELHSDINVVRSQLDGFSKGFATIEDLHTQKDSITQIRIQLLDKTITDTRQQQCGASNKRYFTEKLHDLLDEYRDLKGKEFILPNCTDY